MRHARWLILSGLAVSALLLSWPALRREVSEKAPVQIGETPPRQPVAAAPRQVAAAVHPPAPPVVAAPLRQGVHGEKAPPDVQAQIDATRERLRAAARPCFVDRPRTPVPLGKFDETVQELSYRYTLRTHHGRGHLADLAVVSSTIADPEVEACIVKAFRVANWRAAGPSDDLMVGDKLRLGDLLALPNLDDTVTLDDPKPTR